MLSTDKLKNKEVINIVDGKSLGYVGDIEVDLAGGAIAGIVIPGERGMFRFFSRPENDLVIPWSHVRTIGDDVVLVELENTLDGF